MSSPGIQSGALTYSTDVDNDPNIPNQHRHRPNIRNRRRSWANNLFPLPHIFTPAPQSILTDVSRNILYLQQTLGIPWYKLGLLHLCRQTPQIRPNFPTDATSDWIISNRRRVSLKYCQPKLGLSNPALWLLWSRLKYLLLEFLWHACWEHCTFLPSKYCSSDF